MDYTIKLLDIDEITCIEDIAASNGLKAADYMTNICRGWIKNQLRGKYIQAAKVADLSELKTALTATVEKIATAEKIKATGG